MINLEKYHNEIKKIGKEFAVDKVDNTPLECASMSSCKSCKFYSAINRNLSCKETRLDWLFSEAQILTDLKITQLMYDRGLSFDGEVGDCRDINCNRCVFQSESLCSDKKLELLKKALKEI